MPEKILLYIQYRMYSNIISSKNYRKVVLVTEHKEEEKVVKFDK